MLKYLVEILVVIILTVIYFIGNLLGNSAYIHGGKDNTLTQDLNPIQNIPPEYTLKDKSHPDYYSSTKLNINYGSFTKEEIHKGNAELAAFRRSNNLKNALKKALNDETKNEIIRKLFKEAGIDNMGKPISKEIWNKYMPENLYYLNDECIIGPSHAYLVFYVDNDSKYIHFQEFETVYVLNKPLREYFYENLIQ